MAAALLKKPYGLPLSIYTKEELSGGIVSFEHPLSGCLIPHYHNSSYSSRSKVPPLSLWGTPSLIPQDRDLMISRGIELSSTNYFHSM
jgi:hypothetical protein